MQSSGLFLYESGSAKEENLHSLTQHTWAPTNLQGVLAFNELFLLIFIFVRKLIYGWLFFYFF